MDIDNNKHVKDRTVKVKKISFMNIFVPVILLITVIGCAILFATVINLDKKVDRLETSISELESDNSYEMVYNAFFDVSDIDGNAVDESEALNIVMAEAAENNFVWNGSDESSSGIKRVYLTFDDGPSANTDRILDVLDEYGIKATFFVVGKENYTEQYKRIVEDGHTLGMHSYSHKYSEVYGSFESYKADLTKLHDFLYEITGVDCNIVRFPGGSSNTVSKVDMKELISYLDQENMVYFDWNVSGGDSSGNYKNANRIANNVLKDIDKYNNAVVLLHDASGKESTVEALSIVIEKMLESEDTVFLPITEDTVKVQHIH